MSRALTGVYDINDDIFGENGNGLTGPLKRFISKKIYNVFFIKDLGKDKSGIIKYKLVYYDHKEKSLEDYVIELKDGMYIVKLDYFGNNRIVKKNFDKVISKLLKKAFSGFDEVFQIMKDDFPLQYVYRLKSTSSSKAGGSRTKRKAMKTRKTQKKKVKK